VRKITSEILGALERLEDLGRLAAAQFTADPHKVGSAKYNFIVAIEGTVDLCNHVIVKTELINRSTFSSELRILSWAANYPAPKFLSKHLRLLLLSKSYARKICQATKAIHSPESLPHLPLF